MKRISRENRRVLMIFAIVILLGISFSLFFDMIYLTQDIQILPMEVEVLAGQGSIGFNADADKLYFGILPVDANLGYRKMDLVNPYNYSLKYIVYSKGEMSDYLVYWYNDVDYYKGITMFVEPNEKKTIKVKFIRQGADFEEDATLYGDLYIIVKRKTILDGFLERFL